MIFLTRPIASGLTGLFLSGALACSAGSPATSTTRGFPVVASTPLRGHSTLGGSNAGNSGLNVSVAGSGNTGSRTHHGLRVRPAYLSERYGV